MSIEFSLKALPFDPASLRRPVRNAMLGSLCLNLLSLATPLYMLIIYDRVMTSRSEATLVAVTVAIVLMLVLLAVFDLFRNIVFARASATFYAELESLVFASCRYWALAGGSARRARPLEDLETVRSFLASPVPGAMIDIIFVPLFLLTLFLIHPLLGVVGGGFILSIAAFALLNKRAMARTTQESVESFRKAADFAEVHWRQVEASVAMGYAARGETRAAEANRNAVMTHILAASTTGSITSVIKGLRQASQITIIAIAAYLALESKVSMGAIIACSILFARALGPVDQLVGSWRTLFQARGAWFRLKEMLTGIAERTKPMPLAPPTGQISAVDVVASAPAATTPILKGVSFALEAGQSMAIIGPSGSGKSTLARVILGVWPTLRGTVRLDGADISHLDLDHVGAHVGYLPQTVELLPGTIAENIRRIGEDDPEGVIEAATRAGAHEMILALPNGYDTVVGSRGFSLSGGQTQRIGLARALYGYPKLIVLDEPDADLDQLGERALMRAIDSLREEQLTLVVFALRSAVIKYLARLLLMNDGQAIKFGPMDDFLNPGSGPKVRVVK
jgi:PrtD family type I secretion system ABC transporter